VQDGGDGLRAAEAVSIAGRGREECEGRRGAAGWLWEPLATPSFPAGRGRRSCDVSGLARPAGSPRPRGTASCRAGVSVTVQTLLTLLPSFFFFFFLRWWLNLPRTLHREEKKNIFLAYNGPIEAL
jgi:hypothetical protein